MEATNTPAREHMMIRSTARTVTRDIRSIGDELTRQGRLRMDVYQTERRLKSAYSILGETVYQDLSALRNVDLNDGRVIEIIAHIRYYQDELARLKHEMNASADVF